MMWMLSLALADPTRFALVAGANDGGPERQRLRYAVTDARAVGGVLTELGGVSSANLELLEEPSPDVLREALRALGERARQAGPGSSVLVYYSGHSDRSGLQLGTDTYRWDTLRADLSDLGASVQIAIIDGCASGTLVREKGGAAVPPFLVSEEVAVEGRAWLTSSSADEVSQEADGIGGSYFTHALVTGLRGGADYDGDQQITLREVHQFAAEETLARTERTRFGAQHPAYDLRLTGVGDFVVTDVRRPDARLRLGEALSGRLYLRDAEGSLVAELRKRAGSSVDLALPAGRYSVVVDDDGLHEGTVRVGEDRDAELVPADLVPVRGEVTLSRGRLYAKVPLAIELLPYPTSEGLDARDQLHWTALGAIAVYGARLRGVSVGSVATSYRDGADGLQLAGAYNHSGGPTRAGQLSFGVNASEGELRGLQVGTVNLARRSRGVQLGVVNGAADHGGLSLGVVQVASSSRGVPLALLPLIGDGMRHVAVWTATGMPLNLGAQLGSRSVYTAYEVGWGPVRRVGSVGLGFGGRLRPGPWRVDVDVMAIAGGRPQASVLVSTLRGTVARPLRGERWAPFVRAGLGLELLLEGPSEPLSALGGLPVSEAAALVPELGVGLRL